MPGMYSMSDLNAIHILLHTILNYYNTYHIAGDSLVSDLDC